MFERERARAGEEQRGRHRIWNRLQALSGHHRARHGARTQKLWDHDLSRSQMLNHLSHPGTPTGFYLKQGDTGHHRYHEASYVFDSGQDPSLSEVGHKNPHYNPFTPFLIHLTLWHSCLCASILSCYNLSQLEKASYWRVGIDTVEIAGFLPIACEWGHLNWPTHIFTPLTAVVSKSHEVQNCFCSVHPPISVGSQKFHLETYNVSSQKHV